jgi:hypothetical protein
MRSMTTGAAMMEDSSPMTSGGLWDSCSFISVAFPLSLLKKANQMTDLDDFFDWLNHGVYKGWVSFPVCGTHAEVALSEEESEEFEAGYDPCVFVLRVWSENIDDDTKVSDNDAED